MSKTQVETLSAEDVDLITVTPEDMKTEHERVLATLTPEQQKAVDRLMESRKMMHFSSGNVNDQLLKLFTSEAKIKTMQNRAALA